MGGFAKALWVLFVIILPFLGVLVYLISHGGSMHERAEQQAPGPAEGVRRLREAGGRVPRAEPAPTSWPSWPT